MVQECLLALACDEWQHVASAAHAHISLLLSVASWEVPDTQHSTSEEKKVSDIRYIIRSKLQKESLVGIICRLVLFLQMRVCQFFVYVYAIWQHSNDFMTNCCN